MKKFFLIMLSFFFSLSLIFSQTSKGLEEVITYYGYEVTIKVEEEWPELYMIIKTTDNNYSEYEHITYIIATSRAVIKYVESYNFDLSSFHRIDFISGNFISELTIKDLFIAAEYDSKKMQQDYINGERSAK